MRLLAGNTMRCGCLQGSHPSPSQARWAARSTCQILALASATPARAADALPAFQTSPAAVAPSIVALVVLAVAVAIIVALLRANRQLRAENEQLQGLDASRSTEADSALPALSLDAFRTIFEAAPVGLIINTPDGKVAAANPAACTMHGYSEEEFLVLDPADFIHPDSLPKFEEYLAVVMAGKEIRLSGQDIRRDGTRFYIEVVGVPLTYDGAPHALGIIQDVTDRVEAERLLEESMKVSADIVTAIPSGLLIYQHEEPDRLYLQESNPGASRLLGEPLGAFHGRDFEALWTYPGDGAIKGELIAALKSNEGWRRDYFRHRDGALQLALRMRAFPMPGNRLGVVFDDILDRKLAENELARHRHHLEDLVRERTAALEAAQHDLIRGERLAMLGRIIGTVSHELRNPLGTIRMSVFTIGHLLQSNKLDRIPRIIERAERGVVRCDRIIEELLNFTRDRTLNKTEESVDDWLREEITDMGLENGIDYDWQLNADTTFFIDSDQLRRAIINLVTNAVQAMQEPQSNGNTLGIFSRADDAGVTITIADTGAGMPPEIRERIFEPLFSTKGFGVGLGVPIIREIVEAHGGTLRYESDVGRGTQAIIFIPEAGESRTT